MVPCILIFKYCPHIYSWNSAILFIVGVVSYFFYFQTLAIDKWNTDSVEEFLDTVMVKADVSENEITDNEI